MAHQSHEDVGSERIHPMPIPLVLIDGLACGPELMKIMDVAFAPDADRRRRVRVALSWIVYFFREGARPVEGWTKNVSCSGFFCFVPEPFNPGESIQCTIVVPSFNNERQNSSVALNCRAKVIRSERQDSGAYGLGCHIEVYEVVRHHTAGTSGIQ